MRLVGTTEIGEAKTVVHEGELTQKAGIGVDAAGLSVMWLTKAFHVRSVEVAVYGSRAVVTFRGRGQEEQAMVGVELEEENSKP